MSLKFPHRALTVGLLLLGGWAATNAPRAWGQEAITRKVKIKVEPLYPDLLKRRNISGVVRIQITVSVKGEVKNIKVMGGHPMLANAAIEALKQWRFEPASEESTGIVEFRFDPSQ